MIRTLITIVLPLVLPTILYLLWAAWAKKHIEANHAQALARGATPEELAEYEISTPWLRLILAGVGLVLVGLVVTTLLGTKNDPDSVYRPPHEANGKVVPGQYVPKSQSPRDANTMRTPATDQEAAEKRAIEGTQGQ